MVFVLLSGTYLWPICCWMYIKYICCHPAAKHGHIMGSFHLYVNCSLQRKIKIFLMYIFMFVFFPHSKNKLIEATIRCIKCNNSAALAKWVKYLPANWGVGPTPSLGIEEPIVDLRTLLHFTQVQMGILLCAVRPFAE